jgi:hypothetical protein
MKTKIALTTILLYIIGCSSTVKPPKWYINPPENKKGIRYTSGIATADDIQSAFDMARLTAESDLGKELKSQLNGEMDRERNVLKGKTTLDRFQATVESVISADVSGATIEKRDYHTKGNMYTAFVLLKYNENVMQEKLLAKLEAEKELYEELKATEMLEDMRKRVKQYQQSGY